MDWRSLSTHLALLQREGIIDTFTPAQLQPGTQLAAETHDAMARADLVVPLLSAKFFENPRCDQLLRKALRDKKQVVPVLLTPFERSVDPTAGLQPLPAPARPISIWRDCDAAWTRVTERLKRLALREVDSAGHWRSQDGANPDDLLRQIDDFHRIRQRKAGYDIDIERLSGDPPFSCFSQVSYLDKDIVFVYGLAFHDGTPDKAIIEKFIEQVHRRCCRFDPHARSVLVYHGPPVSSELRLTALHLRVDLCTLTECRGLIDFRVYLADEALRIGADRNYPVELYVQQRLRYKLDGAHESEDSLGLVADWILAPEQRFVMILGDPGAGKSFLLRKLALVLIERGGLVPVLVELRHLEKARSLRELLAQHLARARLDHQHEAFEAMLRAGQIALLFDGFDELALRVGYDQATTHLDTVVEAVQGKAKVILTSRTSHFLLHEDVETALLKRLRGLTPRIGHLQPFDEDRVRKFLERLGPEAEERYALLQEVKDLGKLARNPRMLGFILEIEPKRLREVKEKKGVISAAALYQELVDRWLGYEHKRAYPPGAREDMKKDLREKAVERLALRLWEQNEQTIAATQLEPVLLELLEGQPRLDSGRAAYQVGSGTLLTRSEENRFGFIHQSVLEWLVARAAARELCQSGTTELLGKAEMSTLMADFFIDLAGVKNTVIWTKTFRSGSDELSKHVQENRARILQQLPPGEARAVDLKNQDLRQIDFPKMDLVDADLSGSDLSGVSLRGLEMFRVKLVGAKLRGANLRGAKLGGADLSKADLRGADLIDADLRGAKLMNTNLQGARLLKARFSPGALAQADTKGAARDQMQVRPIALCGAASALAWSPDGEILAVARSTLVLLIEVATARVRAALDQGSTVCSAVFLDDGHTLASGGSDGHIIIWSLISGEKQRDLVGHRGRVNALVLRSFGRMLASAGDDGCVRLWAPSTGKKIHEILAHRGRVLCLAFGEDGRRLASGGEDGRVLLWNVTTTVFEELRKWPGNGSRIWSVALGDGGRLLASAGDDGRVALWSVSNGDLVRELFLPGTEVRSVAFGEGGRTLASSGKEGRIVLWDVATGERRRELAGHETAVLCVAFGAGGQLLASGGSDGRVILWQATTGDKRREITGHGGGIQCVAVGADGGLLASGGTDGKVMLWDLRTPSLREVSARWGAITGIVMVERHQELLCSGEDGKLVLWDILSGQRLQELAVHKGAINGLAVDAGGKIATCGDDGKVVLRSQLSAHEPLALEGHWVGGALCVAFGEEGRTLASGGADGKVILWTALSGQKHGELIGHKEGVRTLCFRGRALASGGSDGKVFLWDVANGTPQREMEGHQGGVRAVGIEERGRTLASGGEDGKIIVWTVATGKRHRELVGHGGSVLCVAYAEGGRTLVSGGEDGKIILWDLTTGAPSATLIGSPNAWVAFAPNGRLRTGGGREVLGGLFFHQIGMCRFEAHELDELGYGLTWPADHHILPEFAGTHPVPRLPSAVLAGELPAMLTVDTSQLAAPPLQSDLTVPFQVATRDSALPGNPDATVLLPPALMRESTVLLQHSQRRQPSRSRGSAREIHVMGWTTILGGLILSGFALARYALVGSAGLLTCCLAAWALHRITRVEDSDPRVGRDAAGTHRWRRRRSAPLDQGRRGAQ